MKIKKIKLTEFKSLIKNIIKEEMDNHKNFTLVIDKESNRYFLTKNDNDKFTVINEKTKNISEMEHSLAKQLFRVVGDANDIENKEMNNLIKSI